MTEHRIFRLTVGGLLFCVFTLVFFRFLLPVLLPEVLAKDVKARRPIRIRGQFRSFNNRSGEGPRLMLSAFARSITPGGEPHRA